MQTPKAETWIDTIERQAAQPLDVKRDWEAHRAWWADFWDRSWIIASDHTLPSDVREKLHGEPSPGGLREEEDGAALVAQSYNVFRFLMACQSRGRIQTKFNGGLFTQQLRLQAAAKSPRPGRPATGRHAGSRMKTIGFGAAVSPTRISDCCTGRFWPAATST